MVPSNAPPSAPPFQRWPPVQVQIPVQVPAMTTSSAGKVRDRLPPECYDMLRKFFTKVSKLPTRKEKEELVRQIRAMSGRQDYTLKVLEGWFSSRRTQLRKDSYIPHLDASQHTNLEALCKELPHDPAKRLVPTWAKMMKADESLVRSWVENWYQSKGLPTPTPEPEPEPEAEEVETKREEEEVDELLMDEDIVPPTPQPPPPPPPRIDPSPAPPPVPQPAIAAHPTPPTPPMTYTPPQNRIVPPSAPPIKTVHPTAATSNPNYYRDRAWKEYTLPNGVVNPVATSPPRPPPPPPPPPTFTHPHPRDLDLLHAIGKAALPIPKAPTPLSLADWNARTDPAFHRMQTFLNRVQSGELASQGWTPDMVKSKFKN